MYGTLGTLLPWHVCIYVIQDSKGVNIRYCLGYCRQIVACFQFGVRYGKIWLPFSQLCPLTDVWNGLPSDVTSALSLVVFKNVLVLPLL